MTYIVTADRTSKEYGTVEFKVEATSEKEAIQKTQNGDAEEINWFIRKSNGYDSNYRVEYILKENT